MLSTQKNVTSTNIFSCPCVNMKKNINGKTRTNVLVMAKKDDISQESKVNSSLKIVSQVGVAVLGLGFIDAGYSGDWSRIGVISKENEDLLKVAAFLVLMVKFMSSENNNVWQFPNPSPEFLTGDGVPMMVDRFANDEPLAKRWKPLSSFLQTATTSQLMVKFMSSENNNVWQFPNPSPEFLTGDGVPMMVDRFAREEPLAKRWKPLSSFLQTATTSQVDF
ncbi:hypothetical protein CTI12_AA098460 [Artemisia annua]|uniref:DUF7887 domain-containing protein n=1 Tax=Artemisia annua TaxID=35608 RepID=A0A2U1PY11_ARTAN|nr:hypothetical protein CTI12_AA098460 [Artemisia annua]